MTGNEYADLIARYIIKNFSDRGIKVYREIDAGKSIIGKNRRVDIFIIQDASQRAVALECKFQETSGTVDEKIPYTLQDMKAMQMPAYVIYAGAGFSEGVVHMLQSSEIAAYCLPEAEELARSKDTRELDHILAQCFHWWDLFVKSKTPYSI